MQPLAQQAPFFQSADSLVEVLSALSALGIRPSPGWMGMWEAATQVGCVGSKGSSLPAASGVPVAAGTIVKATA
jgi:hypothetical protein